MAGKSSNSSLWIGLGCGGCLLLVVLTIGAVVGAGWLGVNRFQGYVEDMEDPERRSQRVAEKLGAESLPEGYHGLFFFSIPFVLEIVAATDDEQLATRGGDFEASEIRGDNRFVFIRFRFEPDGDVRAELGGVSYDSKDGSTHIQTDELDLESEETLGEGEFELGEQLLRYRAHRGTLEGDPGIYASVAIDCPGEKNRRAALWFSSLSEAQLAGEEPVEIDGTPADRQALEAFFGHFDVCP